MKIIPRIFRPLPQRLYLEPVFGCNYRCFFCIHGSGHPMAPVQLAPEIFEKLKPLIEQASHIHITGMGEPFLNRHFADYLSYIRDVGKKYYINSNGSLINETHIRLLLTSFSELSISLDAADPQTYQQMRHQKTWSTVTGVIKRITELKKREGHRHPLLYISYHINKKNLQSLNYLPDLCRELGIEAVKLSWTLLSASHEALSPFDVLSEAAGAIREIATRLRRQGVGIRDEVLFQSHTRGCWDLTGFTFIGAGGQVASCCSRWLTVGDLNFNPFRDIWNGQPHRNIFFGVLNRKPVSSCQTCRQLRSVDYRTDSSAFAKDFQSYSALLAEKQSAPKPLPALERLDLKFEAGFEALMREKPEAAINQYETLSQAYPEYYEIRNNLAAAYFLSGQPEKSKKLFADIHAIPHNDSIISYNRDFLRAHSQDRL